MIVMMRAVEFVGLRHEIAMRLDLFGLDVEQIGAVRDDVERNTHRSIGIKLDALEIAPREHRRVDEGIEIRRLECRRAAIARGGIERGPELPTLGKLDRGLDHDLPGEIAGRVERHRIPLDIQHVRRHHHPTLVIVGGRDDLKIEIERRRTHGHVDAKSVNIHGIARPLQSLVPGADGKSRDLVDAAGRRVVAGNPARIKEHHRPRAGHGNGLMNAENVTHNIGGIDLQPDRAAEGDVLGRGDLRRHRLQRGRGLRVGGGTGQHHQRDET